MALAPEIGAKLEQYYQEREKATRDRPNFFTSLAKRQKRSNKMSPSPLILRRKNLLPLASASVEATFSVMAESQGKLFAQADPVEKFPRATPDGRN